MVELYSEGVMSNDRIAAFLNTIDNEQVFREKVSITFVRYSRNGRRRVLRKVKNRQKMEKRFHKASGNVMIDSECYRDTKKK